jgi:hypothetical protein
MQKKIEGITKWLKNSGMVVTESKTERCLFYKKDLTPVTLKINNSIVRSKKVINVLGVLFDSKMTWAPQVEQTITKANKALNAIRLIRKYFSSRELLQIITSNFYSILFYNSEIWYFPKLNQSLKHSIFATSAQALKISLHYPFISHSHYDLHKITQRATLNMYCKYKIAILLYKTFNNQIPYEEWLELNFLQTNMSRQNNFMMKMCGNTSIGHNILTNKLIKFL